MAIPQTENITLRKGSTYSRVVRWDTGVPSFIAISAITQAAPVAITAVGHGVPEGWLATVVSAEGMREINNPTPNKRCSFDTVSVSDVDNITFPFVNAASYSAYTSGGYVKFFAPHDLTGYVARMVIKANKNSAGTLGEIDSLSGAIVLDNVNKTITYTWSDELTAALTGTRGVYSLKLESPSGDEFAILEGRATFKAEVTP